MWLLSSNLWIFGRKHDNKIPVASSEGYQGHREKQCPMISKITSCNFAFLFFMKNAPVWTSS